MAILLAESMARTPASQIVLSYRAVPGVLVATAQFIWKHKTHSPFTDMWIVIAIIVSVYLGLFMLETIWNCVSISPVRIHSRQSETISAFAKENELLKLEQAIPEVSPQERRRRDIVSAEAKNSAKLEERFFVISMITVRFTLLTMKTLGILLFETLLLRPCLAG